MHHPPVLSGPVAHLQNCRGHYIYFLTLERRRLLMWTLKAHLHSATAVSIAFCSPCPPPLHYLFSDRAHCYPQQGALQI